jgi:Domain of unknown function (DUF4091)
MTSRTRSLPRRRRVVAGLVGALSLCAFGPGAATAAVDTWTATPSDRIFPDATPPATAATTLAIDAARNEAEGGQVLVRSDSAATLTPVVSDLTGPGTIPASQVEIYRVGFVTLTTPSTGVDALHGGGRYPDPLIPVSGSIDVPANETTSIYVLVNVPEGAAAGTYTGSITLAPGLVVPISVDVAPVSVNRDEYPIVARMNLISLAKTLGVADDDPRLIAGLHSSLLPLLRSRGVGPGRAPATSPKVDDATWALDFSNTISGTNALQRSDNLDRFVALGFPSIEVPFLPNFPQAGGEDRTYLKNGQRLTAAQSIATRFGPFISRTFALPVDEPAEKNYIELIRAARQLHAANPPIPVMVTEAPSEVALKNLGSSIDIWAPPLWDLYKSPEGGQKVRAQGKKLWWYTYGSDVQRFTPNVLIDKPGAEPRMIGWLAARENVDGFLYWGLNNWEIGDNVVRSPWVDAWYLSHEKVDVKCGGEKRKVGGNGEASLIWPGPSVDLPAYGSLRLEGLRDGAEDRSLLSRLKATDPVFYERLINGVVRPFSGASDGGDACSDYSRPGYLPVFETDPAAVHGARKSVLTRLSNEPLPTLSGRVVYGAAAAARITAAGGRSPSLAGKPVFGAVVRFGVSETTTDSQGRWTLTDVSTTPGTLRVSRDPAGEIDAVEAPVSAEMLAAGSSVVTTPPLPTSASRAVLGAGLGKFVAKRAPARARTSGDSVTMTVGNSYNPQGESLYKAGGTTPSVEAFYAKGATKAERNWSGYRYLDFTVQVLKAPPANQRWYLIVTPGGSYLNSRNLAVGRSVQNMRIDLRWKHPEKGAMRNLGKLNYLRFGLQSALPKQWRGEHRPTTQLKISNIRLVK